MLTLFRTFNLRHLTKHKLRTATIIFGVALGVIMVVATALVNQSILRSYRSLIDTAGGKTGLQVLSNTRSSLPESMVGEVAKVKGVKAAVPVVRADAFAFIKGEQSGGLLIYGIDPKKDVAARDYEFSAGRQIKPGEPSSIVVTKVWAKEKDLKLGDKINVTGSKGFKEFKIIGLLADSGPARASLGSFAVMDIDTAQSTFNRVGKVDQVDIVLGDDEKPATVQKRIKAKLNGRAEVEIPATRGTDVQKSVEGMGVFVALAAMISLFVGASIIFNNLEISVEERRKGISTLRALGLPRRKILSLVLIEAVFLGLIGSVFGIIFGTVLANALSVAFADSILAFQRVRITDLGITLQVIILGLLMGPVIAAVASIGPALRMLKVAPLEALRPFETAWRPKASIWKFILSVLLFTAGIGSMFALVNVLEINNKLAQNNQAVSKYLLASVFLTFLGSVLLMPHLLSITVRRGQMRSFTWRMALDNLRRVPGRTAATITGMMIAITMMVAMSGMTDSLMHHITNIFDKMLGWDLLVEANVLGTSGGVPLTEDFGKELAKVKGVKIITPETFNVIKLRGYNVQLTTLDMNSFFKWSDIELKEGEHDRVVEDMKKGRSIMVNSMLAKKFGFEVGEIVTLNTPTGKARLKVAGVFNYMSQDPGTMFMERSDYKKYWKDDSVDSFAVVVAEGHNAKDVAKRIKDSFAKDYGIKVRETAEFKDKIRGMINSQFSLTNMLIYIAIIVAAFGIINSSLISILQRSRELSIVRALGARRRQVRRIILNESIVMGFAGALLGGILGIGLGLLMVIGQGIIFDMAVKYYIPWMAVLVGFAISLGLTVMGSVIPARAALKVEIVEGIKYE